MSEKPLKGRVAWVTGSARGIGKSIAAKLAELGCDLALSDVLEAELAATADELSSATGCRTVHAALDVTNRDGAAAFVQRVSDELGGLTILINNAGITRDGLLMRMSESDWDRVIGVNLTGQFLCARDAIREFKRRGVRPDVSCAAGKIICVSSVHEVIPWAGHVNYSASKGGVALMMKSIAQEVAPYRIRVNSICPGAIRTPINRGAWETREALERLLTLIPYNRIGEPEDIGRFAVWLASDEADYITGQSLFIDGGMTLYPGFADNG